MFQFSRNNLHGASADSCCHSFPAELEKYFASILDRIDKIHRKETARIFLVACEALQPIPLISLKYLVMEIDDVDYALKLEIAPISDEESYLLKSKWKKLLNNRCGDLLEVSSPIRNAKDAHNMDFDGEYSIHNRVEFLHRTVRDFLRDNYQDELRRRVGDHFDARISLEQIINPARPFIEAKIRNDWRNALLCEKSVGVRGEILFLFLTVQ
jgi:hypothetical protein